MKTVIIISLAVLVEEIEELELDHLMYQIALVLMELLIISKRIALFVNEIVRLASIQRIAFNVKGIEVLGLEL